MFELLPRKVVTVDGGNVYHCLKSSDSSYTGFGESYFSTINLNYIKGWKRHRVMHMNLCCIHGEVQFYISNCHTPQDYDFSSVNLTPKNHSTLSVFPGAWFAFRGLSSEISIILNISSIEHNETEVDRLPLNHFLCNWL